MRQAIIALIATLLLLPHTAEAADKCDGKHIVSLLSYGPWRGVVTSNDITRVGASLAKCKSEKEANAALATAYKAGVLHRVWAKGPVWNRYSYEVAREKLMTVLHVKGGWCKMMEYMTFKSYWKMLESITSKTGQAHPYFDDAVSCKIGGAYFLTKSTAELVSQRVAKDNLSVRAIAIMLTKVHKSLPKGPQHLLLKQLLPKYGEVLKDVLDMSEKTCHEAILGDKVVATASMCRPALTQVLGDFSTMQLMQLISNQNMCGKRFSNDARRKDWCKLRTKDYRSRIERDFPSTGTP